MIRLQGIAVSPGVAIGEALVMGNEGFRIPRRFVARDAVEDEVDRLRRAVDATASEIARHRDVVSKQLGDQYGAIFEAHLQMIRDARLASEVEGLIRERQYSPEYAVSRAMRRLAKVFESLAGSPLAERAHDIFDIEKRLLRALLGKRREELSHLTVPVLLLAHNLTPSEAVNLDRRYVKGFVTEVGGPGSHTAIVAGALEIPAVVGMGPFLTDVSGGDLVVIDGNSGVVILHPDEATLAKYREEAEANRNLARRLEALRDLPAETADGVQIRLSGNIEFPIEVNPCLDRGADGIGLYRTEFLYLGAEQEPTEEVHFEAYAQVVRAMAGRPVVIRTLDLGADKVLVEQPGTAERNPFLGLRSIRLSLRNVPQFRVQLRAILRASALGDVRVMFPLVTTIFELRQAKMILADVMEDLEECQVPFNRRIPVGMMVEVPAAVIMIEQFVREVDFLSIGTNDLIQYTLATDRDNKDVANLYSPCDPAVLRLIDMAVQAADRARTPINVCGQMAGRPIYVMLLLGLGLRSLSLTPAAVPEIKRVCRGVTMDACRQVAQRALQLEHARDIKNYLKEELKKIFPDWDG